MNFLVHLVYLAPLVAALGILLGLPARRTSVIATLIAIVAALIVFIGDDRVNAGYQFASAMTLVTEWDLKFFVGVDGLSATLLLLTSIVALAAVWLAPRSTTEKTNITRVSCLSPPEQPEHLLLSIRSSFTHFTSWRLFLPFS